MLVVPVAHQLKAAITSYKLDMLLNSNFLIFKASDNSGFIIYVKNSGETLFFQNAFDAILKFPSLSDHDLLIP